MVSDDELLNSVVSQLQSSLGDLGLSNNLAQVRSKHLLESVSPEAAAGMGYTYSVARLKRVSTSALRTALLLSNSRPTELGDLSSALLRAAEGMERLADLPDETRPTATRLISAGLYQLAGYEANSLCIARELPLRPMGGSGGTVELANILERWTVLALRRQLLRLKVETEQVKRSRDRLERLWLESAEDDNSSDRLLDLAAVLLAAEMYGALASAALQGPAFEHFFRQSSEELAELLMSSGRALELLAIRTLQGVGNLLIRNSVWHQLPSLVQTEPIWERYATLSARGTAANMLDSTSRIELWESQRQAISAGLLDADSGFSIRMPTSAGKTRIAELAILNVLAGEGTQKAIYVAPFRALADEVEEGLAPILADLGFRVSSVLGGFEVDELEAQIIGGADLIVTTPEKLSILTRIRPELLGDVGLVILDEGHVIEDRDRGVRYELLLTRLRQRILPSAKILFVSAVISSENAADFAEWLCSGRGSLIESDWRPTRQLIGIYNASRDRIEYPLEDPVAGADAPFVIGAATPHTYTDYTPKLRREKSVRFPERVKGQTVAELAINFAKQGPVLVSATTRDNAESVARTIQRALQLRRQTVGVGVPAPFSLVQERPANAAIEVASQWLGDASPVVSLLAEGIGLHHAGIPDVVRRAVERDCRAGLLPVIVATTTLAQGVNLPVKTVVIHSVERFDEEAGDDGGRMQEISPRELWNIIGRAGRATRENEGHVIFSAKDDFQAGQYEELLRRQIPSIQGHLFSVLQDLSSQRLSDERFRRLLDADLITLMVEESVNTSAENLFQELIGKSFVSIHARNYGLELEPLYFKGTQTINAIRSEVSSEETRRVFSRTGMDVHSCLTLRNRISERKEEVEDVIFSHYIPLDKIVATVLPDIVDLQPMDTGYDFPGDLVELANDWLSQLPMPEIIERHLSEGADPRKFHRFIADLFGFKLPWGIGAYVAIAEHVLESDMEVSEVVRWLPTMFRYGVSTPNASWAMTLGCPSRNLSATLASGFAADVVDGELNYGTFVSWFSSLTEEDFTYRFEASAHESEVLSRRSAALVPINRVLTQALRTKATHLTANVVGIQYENRLALLAGVAVNSAVQLARDYNNQYDPNAIEIRVAGGILGYIPRGTARILAPQIDAGAQVTATVTQIYRSQPEPAVTLEVSVESELSEPPNRSNNTG